MTSNFIKRLIIIPYLLLNGFSKLIEQSFALHEIVYEFFVCHRFFILLYLMH